MAPAIDGRFARWAAERAGTVLRGLRDEMGFDDPDLLRKEGDRRAHEEIAGLIARWRPADALLSEEGVHSDAARLGAERVWIVDPLDGTREFGEPGRSDWAVHVALWQRGLLAAGAVALPARGVVLSTDRPPSYPTMRDGPVRLACSRTCPPALLAELAERLGAELVPMGRPGSRSARW